ncbi:DUF4097 family beta strand repeat-containing protein [Carnobacterium gallinarum]|uniref:DUF4097 family beta strand repeat-containing protein n=1 Tax=Carnobacterium gallinarum TaxID=2749 RepID=UPI00054E8540|nr:DUF4097 family beta strand repeat-containing protein [Carnobacterium gallinarum]
MDLIENYFKELKTYFTETDLEDYNEIKEVLKEHIDVSLEEGRTIEEVIASMAPPEEIASDFFEDRRLETAINAKKDVVASEEVQAFFMQNLKRKIKVISKSIFLVVRAFFSIFLLCALLYFTIYLSKELIKEGNLAIIPLSSILLITSTLLFLLSIRNNIHPRNKIRLASLFLFGTGILILVVASLTDTLFYHGEDLNIDLVLTDNKDIQLTVNSDADVEIAAVEVPENEPFRIMVDGYFSKSDRNKIEKSTDKNKVNLTIDQFDCWNLFTRTGDSDIIIFIPKGLVLDKINFDLIDGKLRLIDVNTDHFKLNMTNGDFYGKNLVAKSGIINNKYGDIVMDNASSKLELNSFNGKNIIDYFNGPITANVQSGLTIIKHSTADQLDLASQSGKVIVEDSTIKKINSITDSGQTILKQTIGDIAIQSNSGKVILQNNLGALNVANTSGNTISVQTNVLASTIKSDTGFIKWVQGENKKLAIEASTKKGKLINLVKNESTEVDTTIKINSNSGDIRVVKIE